jgi:hypothetical protein
MTLGRQALMKDLVDIFELASDGRPSTIEEQQRYHEDWFKSLGH